MAVAKVDRKTFIELFEKHGGRRTARILGITQTAVMRRRRRTEADIGRPLLPPDLKKSYTSHLKSYPQYISAGMENGHVLIGSDSHYWPDIISTAHRAFVKFNEEFKPKIVIKNGDELDAPSVSRFAPIMWEEQPKLEKEIETVQQRLEEIRQVNNAARYIWPFGNHDARYETRLATVAREYANLHGFHLKDYFPKWEPCWAMFINDDIFVKHRFKGGIHATRNNTLNAGRSIFTGHLHSLKVTPFRDLNGNRYGGDTGTMADPHGPQFANYTEGNPMDCRSGFILLTIADGLLLWPEVIHVLSEQDGIVEFRGELIYV